MLGISRKWLCLFFILFSNFSSLFATAFHWEVTGDFLYLLPSVDDTFFVFVQDTLTFAQHIGKKVNDDFGFHPGFRVAASYISDTSEHKLVIDYTQLNARSKRSISGRSLQATVGSGFATNANASNYTGTAQADLHLLHKRADVIFFQPLWCLSGLNIGVIGGVEFAFNRLVENYLFQDFAAAFNVVPVDLNSSTYGVGPQIGLSFNHILNQFCFGCLSLDLIASASVLPSRTNSFFHTGLTGEFPTLFDNIRTTKTWRLVPAVHGSIGLNFSTRFSCIKVLLRCGYEFNSYIRGLLRNAFTSPNANSLTYTYYYNFDIQGFYVSASTAF